MSQEDQKTQQQFVVRRKSYAPRDLAEAVHFELINRKASCPKLEVLVELFESMYFASLKTEESRPVAFHLVYLNPENPDPKPPSVTVHNRWSCVRLAKPVALSEADFLKIAAASDPRTSSFAVHEEVGGRIVVWGLIDQGNSYHDYVNFDSETGPERPGLFQASITGAAHLVAYINYDKVAELKQNTLLRSAIDVLRSGPVREALDPGIQSHLQMVRAKLPDFPGNQPMDWPLTFADDWTSAIRRLLLRVQNLGHGGAFLLTSDQTLQNLSIKHGISYTRLRSALQRHAVTKTELYFTNDEINEEYLEKDADDMPVGLHLDEVVGGYNAEEIRSELDSAIWFVSLLTRVDGLVLLNHELEVKGFGVEITTQEEPSEIFLAGDALATEWKLKELNYQLYGTRHRSMMRYCSKFAGSVGFVISQDGDVRVMTKVGNRLIFWDNIRLQLPEFVRRRRYGRSIFRTRSRA